MEIRKRLPTAENTMTTLSHEVKRQNRLVLSVQKQQILKRKKWQSLLNVVVIGHRRSKTAKIG
jgi:uncharacterized protein HemY